MNVETNQKKCNFCKKDIDKDATRCHHCQADLRGWTTRHPILTIFIILISAPLIIGGYYNSSSETAPLSSQETLENSKNYNATKYSSNLIKNGITLKSPSTADYKTPSSATRNATNTYEVSSYVDSQNSYGAQIRSYWTVNIKYVGEEIESKTSYIDYPNNWKVTKVEFDGKNIPIK